MAVCLECGFDGRTEGAACPKCAAVPTLISPVGSVATDPTVAIDFHFPPVPSFAPGATLARKYEIRRRLGGGGFGVVYLAHDIGLDKAVAVKVLQVADPSTMEAAEAKKRFVREARALARLDTHPNIVRVMNVDEENGVPYYIMEYLPEGTLLDLLRKGPLPPSRAAALCADVAAALASVHATGTIHRDLKPANVFIKGERAMLGDFGIARVAQESALTVGSGMPGTPLYMAPESLLGKEVDGRADLFSLGCVLYEALTGVVLFRGDSLGQVVSRIVDPDDVDLRPLKEAIPAPLIGIMKRSLAKRVSERYPSARFMERDLRAFAADTSSPAGATPVKVSPDALHAVTHRAGSPSIRIPEPRAAKRGSESRSLVLASGALILAAAALWFVVRAPHGGGNQAAASPPSSTGPSAADRRQPENPFGSAQRPPVPLKGASSETPARDIAIQVDVGESVRTEALPPPAAENAAAGSGPAQDSTADVSARWRPITIDDALARRGSAARFGAGVMRPTPLRDTMQAPEVINKVEPEYPEAARVVGEEGKVVVEIVVDQLGEVSAAKVIKGNPFFDEAALTAVRQWRFRPAMDGGHPVKVAGTVTVDFKMKP